MLRIGEFSDTFLPVVDGVGRVVQAYAETLSAMGHQVTVVAPMYDTGARGGLPYELLDFIATPLPGMKQYRLGEAMLDAHYRKRIRMVELDIVHAHSPFTAGSEALRLASVRKIPLVATFHSKYYDDFLHKRWADIQRRLKLSAIQLEELKREIKRLNPRPGSSVGEKSVLIGHQILPDFIVEADEDGHITMQLNGGNPSSLVISPDATEMLQTYENMQEQQLSKAVQEEIRFTREYVERGRIFIDALAQRRESMIKTMNAIIKLQRPFFLEGDDTLLKPMKLEDVANLAGYDIRRCKTYGPE